MDILRTWILGVTAAAVVLAAAQALMPEGAVKRVGRFTGGLVLCLALLQPLAALEHIDWSGGIPDLPAVAATGEEKDPMKPIIEGELAAYIEEQGKKLGADLRARVTCTSDENGVPVPRYAAVSGRLTEPQRQALSAVIAGDLGIPAADQSFREE